MIEIRLQRVSPGLTGFAIFSRFDQLVAYKAQPSPWFRVTLFSYKFA